MTETGFQGKGLTRRDSPRKRDQELRVRLQIQLLMILRRQDRKRLLREKIN